MSCRKTACIRHAALRVYKCHRAAQGRGESQGLVSRLVRRRPFIRRALIHSFPTGYLLANPQPDLLRCPFDQNNNNRTATTVHSRESHD